MILENFKLKQMKLKEVSCLCCVMSDLSLDHSWPLCPEHLHCLEDINNAFVAHSLQDDAEGDEDSCPPYSSTRKTSKP